MYALHSVDVAGVRSFQPPIHNTSQSIQFRYPITMIKGANGSGKTTIIESLRYVCTGDPPPNSMKGQRFVNDPRLSNQTENQAKIVVWLRDVRQPDSLFGITRSMKVVLRGNKYSFSKMESTLTNQEAGQSLEDNLWPFGDDKKVQELFDKIFASHKYTQALGVLKDHTKFLKDKKLEIEGSRAELVERQKRFATLKEFSDTGAAEIKKNIEELQGLTRGLQEIEEQVIKLADNLEIAETFSREAQRLEEKIKHLMKEQDRLKDVTVISGATIPKLTEKLTTLPNDIIQKEELIQKLSTGIDHVRKRYLDSKKMYDNVAASIGAITERTNQIVDLEVELIKSSVSLSTFGISIPSVLKNYVPSSHSFEDDFSMFNQFIASTLSSAVNHKEVLEKKLYEQQALMESQQTRYYASLREIDSKIISIKRESEQIDKQMSSLNSAIPQFEAKLASGAESEYTMADIELQKHLKQEEKMKNLHGEINLIQKSLVEKKELLSKAHSLSNKLANYKAEIAVLNRETDHLQRVINQTFTESDLSNLTTLDNLSSVSQLNTQLETVEGSRQSLQRSLDQVQYQLADKEAEIRLINTNHKTLRKSFKRIQKILKHMSRPTVLRMSQVSRKITVKRALITSFDEFYDDSCTSSSCSLCKSKLTKERLPDFLEELSERKVEAEQIVGKLVGEEEKLTENLKKLNSIKELYLKYQKDVTELSSINVKFQELTDQQSSLDDAVDSINQEKERVLRELKTCDSRKRSLEEIKFNFKKISTINQQLSNLQSTIDQEQGLFDPPEVISASISELESTKTDLESTLSHFQERHLSLMNERSVKLNLTWPMSNNDYLETQSTLQDLKLKKVSVEKPHQSLIEEKSRVESRFNSLASSLKTEISTLNESVKSLTPIIQNIKSLLEKIGSRRSELIEIKETVDRVDQIKSEYETLENRFNEQKDQLAKEKEALGRLQNLENVILMNIQLLQNDEAQNELVVQIQSLETSPEWKLATQLSEIKQRHKEKENLRQNYLNKISHLEGRKAAQKQSMSNAQKQLCGRDFENLDHLVKQVCVDFEAVDAGIKDTTEYMDLVNTAIIEYHRTKLEILNEKIGYLWQQTYHGKDIDSVKIETNTEITARNQARKYKYRVVFVQNGVSVDMKGQCSAGQKVLASIIIRLALAETFGVRCNFLTLDEPTTNLDVDNARGLANSLAKLTVTGTQSLQLVIITHDGDFINQLIEAYQATGNESFELPEDYYEVTKNAQGFSEITTKRLSCLRQF
ncbi:hypothetical protein GEMRC1_007932 [Eukaryota sp. GEM-RC1]